MNYRANVAVENRSFILRTPKF